MRDEDDDAVPETNGIGMPSMRPFGHDGRARGSSPDTAAGAACTGIPRRHPARPAGRGSAASGPWGLALLVLGALLGGAPLGAQDPDSAARGRPPAAADGGAGGEAGAIVTRVEALLMAGMPVTASRVLARELSLGVVEGPDAVLLAASAYLEQRSWEAARRLLVGHEWPTPELTLRSRLALARAYTGLDSTRAAIAAYEAIVADTAAAPGPLARVELARALERAGRTADAGRQLALAETENVGIARWMRLSRFQLLAATGDTAALALIRPLLADDLIPDDSVYLPAAVLSFRAGRPDSGLAFGRRADRGVWRTLAEEHVVPHLLERGDTAGAVDGMRAALERGRAEAATGPALLALEDDWRARDLVGRSDLRSGRPGRAVEHLGIALAGAPAGEQPGIAETLARAHRALGRDDRAIQTLQPWLGGRPASDGQRASLWLLAAQTFAAMGESAASAEAYEEAAGGSGNSAALAAYLIADTHHDEGRLAEARAAYERSFERFPGSSYGSRSLERLALLHFHEGRYAEARDRLDEYRRRYPTGDWTQGAGYWNARVSEAEGDTATARALYVETIERDPLDYYAILAAARASRDRWAAFRLRPSDPLPPLDPAHAEALSRMNLLRDLGWVSRARREWRRSRDQGSNAWPRVLAYAHALNASGWTQEGVAEGWRAKAQHVGWSRPLLEAIYPLPFAEPLADAARRRGLDPHFVAGLSRRESLFDPEIVSVANAVGLMQLLPQTARDVAPRAGLPEYSRSQLSVPQVNLLLGTQYLADVLERFDGEPIAGMISYNAGPHRFLRWRGFPEFTDSEKRVERIPFRETREYVRAVTELTEIYRFLYPDFGASVP